MQRPTSVLVFGILNIVFGVLGFCGVIGSAVILFGVKLPGENPMVKVIQDNPGYKNYLIVTLILSIVFTFALLAAGIGLLNSQPWARTASIVYGWFAIVNGIIGAIVNVVVLIPSVAQQTSGQNNPQAAGAMGGAIGGICGGLIGLIFPVLLLIFMNRANVVEYFAAVRNEADATL